MKKENLVCPECGYKFGNEKSVEERIEILKAAGVDMSQITVTKAGDAPIIIQIVNGTPQVIDDDILQKLADAGTVKNPKMYRRWILALVFNMLNSRNGFTEELHRKGYEYMWRMILEEMRVQASIYHDTKSPDTERYAERIRFYNKELIIEMCELYIKDLRKHLDNLEEKNFKGRMVYKVVNLPANHPHKKDIHRGKNIFTVQIGEFILQPLQSALWKIKFSKNPKDLYIKLHAFDSLRIRLSNVSQYQCWISAYKGYGAYFAMKNLIHCHDYRITDEFGKTLNLYKSAQYLSDKAEEYKKEGWRLMGVLKKFIEDNGINVSKKLTEWRKESAVRKALNKSKK